MIGQSLLLVFASLAAVSGSCIGIPIAQTSGSSQVTACGSCYSGSTLGSSTPCGDFFSAAEGPGSSPVTLLQAPSVAVPAAVTPVISLSTQPAPAPRVIAERCICTKTVVKPQIIQREIIVPRLQRYIKRTVTPVVENIVYKSTPVSRGPSSGVSGQRALSSTCGISGARCVSSCTPVISRRCC